MSNFKLQFHKLRVLIFSKIIRFFAFILFVELPPVPSVSAIIRNGNKLLSVKLSYFDGYALPGGHIEKGESVEEALIREVYEETGLKVKSYKYFGSYATIFYKYPALCAVFIVEVSGSLKASAEGELCWIDVRKIKDLLFYEDNRLAINDYLKQ